MIPLAIFCRPPVPGRVKTRLARALGDERAAELYAAFVSDAIACAARVPELSPELWVAGDPDDAHVLPIAGSLPRRAQTELDLGGRMAHALAAAIAAAGAGLVVGTDAPTLPDRALREAAQALRTSDVVLGPAADGGYYLVGARGRAPNVFTGVRYSTSHTLGDTLARARREGLEVALLEPWYDVDTPRDLRLLQAHLALDPKRAPASARVLIDWLP